MELIYTKEASKLEAWDQFITSENRGSHLMLSDWIKSYQSYGFDYEICILMEGGHIVGGYAAIVAKAFIFKFYILPFGPIVSKGFEHYLNDLISSVSVRGSRYKCCYAHVNLAQTSNNNPHICHLEDLEALKSAEIGHLFKFVYSVSGLNWIDLIDFDEEKKLASLKPSMRRNIRNSYRKELRLEVLDTPNKIKAGYLLFDENAKSSGYSIRDWKDIEETLLALQEKGTLKMLGSYKNDMLKGAILLVKAGNYFTYILGGSKKEVPDLRTGDFLQWEALKLSIDYGFDGYNISLGGSEGVVQFKNSFNTEEILFENSKYHWVLNPYYFKCYQVFEKKMKPYKKFLSKILSLTTLRRRKKKVA